MRRPTRRSIAPAERRLDPARPAAELARRVRALTPHIGAFLELADGERLGVRGRPPSRPRRRRASCSAGSGLRVGCAEGVLRVLEVRPAGGRAMGADAYLRGHPAPRLR